MNKTLTQVVGGVLGTTLLAATAVAVGNGTVIGRSASASAYSTILNANNSPTIVNEQAVVVDDKGVTWEYQGVQNYNNGHISLKNGGYFGVSPETNYGYTAVEGITVNFEDTNNELWLLKSIDGVDWSECRALTSGDQVFDANNWRYFRFYNWSDDNTNININSVTINYNCSGVSSSEDVDSAKLSNVISTSENLTAAQEFSDISPLSDGGEAVSFTKTNDKSTSITLGFGRTYTIGEIKNAKVEFDMKTVGINNYAKTIVLVNGTTIFGSTINSRDHSAYKCTHIADDWYHIEVPVTAFASTISGYDKKDLPANNILTKEINGIKINAGTCTIDNLRISRSSYELGIFNSPTYKPVVGEIYWLKVSWVGVLHAEKVEMSFSDNTMARHIPLTDPKLKHGSPFYLEWLSAGTCTITCTVVSGYNRQVQTINFTVTVK